MTGFTLRNLASGNLAAQRWNPHKDAVIFGDHRRTYAELSDGIDELARGFAAEGMRPGDRVLVLLPNCIEYVELFFAITSLGAVIVPTNYLLSADEVAHVMDDSGATWVIAHNAFAKGIAVIDRPEAQSPRIFGVGGLPNHPDLHSLRAGEHPPAPRAIDPGDIAVLQYTSGTSGHPKGAVHTHSTLMFNALQQMVDFGITVEDVYVCVPALCWAAGFHDFTLPTLWSGGTVVLTESRGFDPHRLATTIETHQATVLVLVPSVLKMVLEAVEQDPSRLQSLRVVLVGGEAIPPEIMERVEQTLPTTWLAPGFGMTEGPMILTCGRQEESLPAGSSGRAMSLTDIRIADAEGNEVPAGEIGEILVQSPATMIGYHKSPGLTEAALKGGWFHTGDSGYVDEAGYLFVKGRLKDMYISGGLNVYPAEIERVISLHNEVLEVAVVGIPHEQLGEAGRAYIVLREGCQTTEQELAQFVRRHLAGYKCPKEWTLLDEPLPRTTSGKLKKSAIREWVS